MQRGRNRFQTLARQTIARLKECGEEVKRGGGAFFRGRTEEDRQQPSYRETAVRWSRRGEEGREWACEVGQRWRERPEEVRDSLFCVVF